MNIVIVDRDDDLVETEDIHLLGLSLNVVVGVDPAGVLWQLGKK